MVDHIASATRDLPHVSIGLPFYNAEAYLLDAIRSVFAQSHQNWELILVDDGSTDRSLEIARSIDDPRVRVYSDGQNRRLAARLNEITRLAQYDYLARMDADDLMARDRLERQLLLLESSPHVDLVTTGTYSLGIGEKLIGVRVVEKNHKIDPYKLLAGQSGILHAAILGRTKWFSRNPYDESMSRSQDMNLWVRSFGKNDLNIGFISSPLYFYREHESITKKKLLLNYKSARSTILEDAINGFSKHDRLKAYMRSWIKTIGVYALYAVGVQDKIVIRRNKTSMRADRKKQAMMELNHIYSCKVPIN